MISHNRSLQGTTLLASEATERLKEGIRTVGGTSRICSDKTMLHERLIVLYVSINETSAS